jgi:hypothetical protein
MGLRIASPFFANIVHSFVGSVNMEALIELAQLRSITVDQLIRNHPDRTRYRGSIADESSGCGQYA